MFCGRARGRREGQTQGIILQKTGHRERPRGDLTVVSSTPFPITTPLPSIQYQLNTSMLWDILVRQASVKSVRLTWLGRNNPATTKPVSPTPYPTSITERPHIPSGCCMRYSARHAPASHTHQTPTLLWWGFTLTVDLFPNRISILRTNGRTPFQTDDLLPNRISILRMNYYNFS